MPVKQGPLVCANVVSQRYKPVLALSDESLVTIFSDKKLLDLFSGIRCKTQKVGAVSGVIILFISEDEDGIFPDSALFEHSCESEHGVFQRIQTLDT